MTQFALRAVVLGVFASGVLLFSALLIGYGTQTKVVTEYARVEHQIFPLIVRDIKRGLSLVLAGKRCFQILPLNPEARAIRAQYETGYMDTYQIDDTQSANTVVRLKCP